MDVKKEYSVGNMAPVVQPDQVLSKNGEYGYIDDAYGALDLRLPKFEETEDEEITEGTSDIITVGALSALLAGMVVYSCVRASKHKKKLKYIEKVYKEKYKDFVPFPSEDFEIKNYKFKKYDKRNGDLDDGKGKEVKSRLKKLIGKTVKEVRYKGTVAFSYIVVTENVVVTPYGMTGTTKLLWKMNKSSPLAKYENYYFAAVCQKCNLSTKKVVKWADSEYKKLRDSEDKPVNESGDEFTEGVGHDIAVMSAAMAGALLGQMTAYAVIDGVTHHKYFKVIETYYKKTDPDFLAFNSTNFKKKVYNCNQDNKDTTDIDGFKGSESKGKISKTLTKLRGMYVCEYLHNGKPAFSYAKTKNPNVSEKGKKIYFMIQDTKFNKYMNYYLAKICINEKSALVQVNKWMKQEYDRIKNEDTMNESTDVMTESKKIDDDMLPITKALEAKGYDVKYSCSGHPSARTKNDVKRDGVRYSKLYTTARVVFAKKYDIGLAPKGWSKRTLNADDGKYENDCTALYVDEKSFKIEDGTPKNAFYKWKASYMDSLKSWVDKLPPAGKEEVTKESVDVSLDSLIDDLFTDML